MALMPSGTVPENKMMGTSGLIFFISFASSDPVVPCNMWSDIVAHTGASRRVFRASSVVVTPMTSKPFCSRTFFRNVRYSLSSSIQRMSGLVAATGRTLRNRFSYGVGRLAPLNNAVARTNHLRNCCRRTYGKNCTVSNKRTCTCGNQGGLPMRR
jgi:hypothetical protein